MDIVPRNDKKSRPYQEFCFELLKWTKSFVKIRDRNSKLIITHRGVRRVSVWGGGLEPKNFSEFDPLQSFSHQI